MTAEFETRVPNGDQVGGGFSSAWQIEGTFEGNLETFTRSCVERNGNGLSGHGGKTVIAKEARELESSFGEPDFGSRFSRDSFTGPRKKRSRSFSHAASQPLEKVELSTEAGDEDRRSEGKTGFGNEYFSNCKNRFPRRSDRKRRETHRSFRLEVLFAQETRQEKTFKRSGKTESTGAVGQVVDGIRWQHASRRFNKKERLARVKLMILVDARARDWRRQNGARESTSLSQEAENDFRIARDLDRAIGPSNWNEIPSEGQKKF
ncbi:MAG: hypothetical protein ABI461_14815 [Polyangiaceae bacterium]